jgi:hypothetical protein
MTTTWIATELRFIGKATVETTSADGNVIVRLADGRKGLVTREQMHSTKREALLFAQTPQAAGWSDVARLGAMVA